MFNDHDFDRLNPPKCQSGITIITPRGERIGRFSITEHAAEYGDFEITTAPEGKTEENDE